VSDVLEDGETIEESAGHKFQLWPDECLASQMANNYPRLPHTIKSADTKGGE
jgi:hypothetical protein